MKLPLATGLLSAAAVLGGGCGDAADSTTTATTSRFVLRVDRTFLRNGRPRLPSEDLPPENYRRTAPSDRWQVLIEGARIVLTAIGFPFNGLSRLEGTEKSKDPAEWRFDLTDGSFAGGRFIIRGDEAELTMYGSGIPILLSERGALIPRDDVDDDTHRSLRLPGAIATRVLARDFS